MPTLAKSGLKGFDVAPWQAIFAPAGTPPAVVKRLNDELTKIVAQTEVAIYRPSIGTWYILQSRDGFKAEQWGSSTDVPMQADYDGDGKADIAIYRPSNGTWYVLQSRDGFKAVQWGFGKDIPVPADYDGDGKTDIAVYRPSDGTWYVLRSRDGFIAQQWGFSTDLPVPAAARP